MTAADQSLVSLALLVGRMTVRDLDLPGVLRRVATAIPAPVGAAGAVLYVAGPGDDEPVVAASDPKAGRIGEVQRRAGGGPLPTGARTARQVHTPDLTRVAPQALAAAAADLGFTTSLVVPLSAAGEPYGALQLLGTPGRPVGPSQADAVRPVLAALVARLVDVRTLRELREKADSRPAPPPPPAPTLDVATTVLRPKSEAGSEATHVVSVPAQRRPSAARHRRRDEPDEPVRPEPGRRRLR
ncbi:hypothetical protein BJF78_19650 [Pseudonocardia sp. CNS-139]|nr:hypothetical protein BJF78_19650 [Pseudonocardia sp. CNS-139]